MGLKSLCRAGAEQPFARSFPPQSPALPGNAIPPRAQLQAPCSRANLQTSGHCCRASNAGGAESARLHSAGRDNVLQAAAPRWRAQSACCARSGAFLQRPPPLLPHHCTQLLLQQPPRLPRLHAG